MTGQDQHIVNALHEMADRAAAPRLSIDATWRAGRRRRRTTMTASVAGAASAVAVAALVPLTVTGGSAGPGPGAGAGSRPGTLRTAPPARTPSHPWPVANVAFRRVSRVVSKPCPDGSQGVPSVSHHTCYFLTGKPMTLPIMSAKVVRQAGEQSAGGQPVYVIDISLTRSGSTALNSLIAKAMNAPAPRDELAWIVNGEVVVSPGVHGVLPTSFELAGNGNRAAQQQIVNEIEARPQFAAQIRQPYQRT